MLPHPSFAEQESLMNAALASATGPKLGALLQTLGMELSSLRQILESPEPGGRPFNNNAVFALFATRSGSTGERRLILRVQNTHAWRRKRITENEVAVMRWISSHGVPLVPTVVAFSVDATSSPLDCEFILMECMAGQSLGQRWADLSQQERENYTEQLRYWLGKLRGVPRPPGEGPEMASFSLQADGAAVEDAGWWCHEGSQLPKEAGASFSSLCSAVLTEAIRRLESEGDLLEELRARIAAVAPSSLESNSVLQEAALASSREAGSTARTALPAALQRAIDGPLARYRDEYEPHPAGALCCCHNDLHPGNLMAEDGRLTGVLDWEAACWGFSDVDCQNFGEMVGLPTDALRGTGEQVGADCGSGLPVAPGAVLRRQLMAVVQQLPSLHFSIASWQGGCQDAAGRLALDTYSRILVADEVWEALDVLGVV